MCEYYIMQALVPENQYLESHLKYSIEFDILCLVSGCKEIIANGFDNKFSYKVQFYKCNVHGRTFYAYTSWLMKNLAEVVIRRILLLIFTGSTPGNDVGERYNISASTLSNLVKL